MYEYIWRTQWEVILAKANCLWDEILSSWISGGQSTQRQEGRAKGEILTKWETGVT